MKIIRVTVLLAMIACTMAIEVKLGSGGQGNLGPKGPVAQFPGAPQQMAPQQPAGQQQSGFGGFGGLGGFNFGNFGNAADKFIGATPSFEDLMNNSKNASPSAPGAAGNPGAAPAKAAPAQAAPVQAAAVPQRRPAKADAPALGPLDGAPQVIVGGYNGAQNCGSINNDRSFAYLGLVQNIAAAFLNGQASGATLLKYASTQVVAGYNHKLVFSLGNGFLGIWVFEGLMGAAPEARHFVYNTRLEDVLSSLVGDSNAKADLNCKASDVNKPIDAQSLQAPLAKGPAPQQFQPAPQAKGPAPQQFIAAPQAKGPAPQQFQPAPQANLPAAGFKGAAPVSKNTAPQNNLNFQQPGLNAQQPNFAVQSGASAGQQFGQNQQNFAVPGPMIINIGDAQST